MSTLQAGSFPDGTHPELQKYIQRKGWPFQAEVNAKRSELKIQTCPFCLNPNKNFEINAHSGLWQCWACNRSGSFESLQRELRDTQDGIATINRVMHRPEKEHIYKTFPKGKIDACHQALLGNKNGALDYLLSRRLTQETIEHFKIGVADFHGRPRLVIPHFIGDKIALIMYRSIPPEERVFSREEGMKSVFFNHDALFEDCSNSVIVCEGQIDAMSVWQAGYPNVVSVSTGAGTDWPNEWVDLLSGFEKIVMLYDGDAAGHSGAETVRQRLGVDRVWMTECPDGMDVNSILKQDGEEGVVKIIETARPAPVDGVMSFSEGIEDLQAFMVEGGDMDEGYEWFLSHLTKCAGKAAPGDVIQLMGDAGVGKTTMMLQQCKYLSRDLRVPTLICEMEMPGKKIVRKLIQSEYQLSKKEITLDVLGDALTRFDGIPLYFYTPPRDVSINKIIDVATLAFKRYGVRALVIDNLIILTEGSHDVIREQGIVSREIKTWARTYGNVVYLLAHPRKVEDGKVQTLGDMRGSGAISANADTVINLWRKSLAPKTEDDVYNFNETQFGLQDPKVAAFCLKGRDVDGSRVGWLYFDGARSYFRNAENEDFDQNRTSDPVRGEE